VVTGSRLHFGLLWGPHGSAGGAGVMIDRPAIVVRIKNAPSFAVQGPAAERIEAIAQRYSAMRGSEDLPAVCLEVERLPEPHTGFGTGTQLGLAVAAGLDRWFGGQTDFRQLAATVAARGRRSAVGTYGFALGGLIVDGGKAAHREIGDRSVAADELGALAQRCRLADGWRWVLIEFPEQCAAVSGSAEQQRFERLTRHDPTMIDRMQRWLESELVPAAQQHQFDAFSEAVYRFNRTVGESFAGVQGGPYGSPQAAACIEQFRRWDIRGVGQSSWGPTLFALCHDRAAADSLVERVKAGSELSGSCFAGARTTIARTRHRPARIAMQPNGRATTDHAIQSTGG
jgi:beta-RFAP synthase